MSAKRTGAGGGSRTGARLMLWLFPLLALACDCAWLPSRVEAPPPLAQLVSLQGEVKIQRGDAAPIPATAKLALQEGDGVETGPGASAVIRYRDGSELTVSENTRLRLEAPGGRLGLRLEEGIVLSRAAAAASDGSDGPLGLILLMSTGSSELQAGSEVRLTLGRDGEPTFEVLQGEVLVLGFDGTRSRVVSGETLNLALRGGGGGEVDAGEEALPVEAPKPPVLMLSAIRGAPEVRGKDAKRFTRASTEPTPLPPGSAFRLPKKARARLESDGVKISLEPGARGTLIDTGRDGEEERIELSFEQGEAGLDFPGEAPRLLQLPAGGKSPAKARVKEPTSARLSKSGKVLQLEVRVGRMELEVNGAPHVVEAGQTIAITGDKALVTNLRAPALVLSASKRVRVYADALSPFGIEVPEEAADALLEIASEAEFAAPLQRGRAPAKLAIVEPTEWGTVHWRFVDTTGKSLREGYARFEPDRGRSVLNESAPQAEVAETGLKASVFFQSALPALRFSFLGREGAVKYRVRVYAAGDLQKPLVDKVVSETACSLTAGQLGEGSYLWAAAPLDAAGAELSGGRMNKLELVYDNSRRGLAIVTPKPGERMRRGPMETRGVAPVGAKLFVNGRAVTVDAKGRFSHELPSTDTLVYRVVTAEGAENIWVRALRRTK